MQEFRHLGSDFEKNTCGNNSLSYGESVIFQSAKYNGITITDNLDNYVTLLRQWVFLGAIWP